MKKYRIKKEAVPFIKETHATSIYDFETWDKLGIDINALEEIEPMYLSFGIKRGDNCGTLGGWSKDISTFEFTIHFPSTKFHEHDEFSKGRITRKLMDRIQRNINSFYEEFVDGFKSENE